MREEGLRLDVLVEVEEEAENEIGKFKELLDMGVDTQEEYDRKVATCRNKVENYKKLDALLYCIWDPGEFIIDSKTHKEYHGFWDYSYDTDELPFLSLHEKGRCYKTILKAYEYKQKWHTFWSFLLARKI